MRQKPKGRASLASIMTPNVTTMPRLPPPYSLTDTEVIIWKMITASMPPDHFAPSNSAVLVQLVRHIAASDRVAMLIETVAKQKGKFNPDQFASLLRAQVAESVIINRLSRSMRLTQQALYRGESARLRPTLNPADAPWHRKDDRED